MLCFSQIKILFKIKNIYIYISTEGMAGGVVPAPLKSPLLCTVRIPSFVMDLDVVSNVGQVMPLTRP